MLIRYNVQTTPKTWTALAHEFRKRVFSNTAFLYLKIYRTGNIFEIFSRKEDNYPLRLQDNDLAEETGSMSNKVEVAAEV